MSFANEARDFLKEFNENYMHFQKQGNEYFCKSNFINENNTPEEEIFWLKKSRNQPLTE